MTHDDATPRTLYTVELTLTGDAAVAGRVTLCVTSRGRDPVTVVIPERPDQIEMKPAGLYEWRAAA